MVFRFFLLLSPRIGGKIPPVVRLDVVLWDQLTLVVHIAERKLRFSIHLLRQRIDTLQRPQYSRVERLLMGSKVVQDHSLCLSAICPASLETPPLTALDLTRPFSFVEPSCRSTGGSV